MTRLSDGAYALLTADPNRFAGPQNIWSYDAWVVKFTPQGDTTRSAYVGDSAARELPNQLIETTDGGLAIVGQQSVKPSSTPRRGILQKLGPDWREQWRYWYAPTMGDYDFGGELYNVNELTNGNLLVSGTLYIEGQMNEVAAPGTPLWTWTPPRAPGATIWPTADILLYDTLAAAWHAHGWGVNTPGVNGVNLWLASLGNLPAPATIDYCATPPGRPAASYQTAGSAATLRFTLDVAATPAGPQYADISRVTWDFGDGTPSDTGRVVTHTFASPNPVRVRCTVTNNLFCTSTTDLWPLGVDEEEVLAAAVSVFPNPSATGSFTLRAPAGATYSVLDATGRTIATGQLNEPETALDLRTRATGVYALRLAWANGRTLTRRLVRW